MARDYYDESKPKKKKKETPKPQKVTKSPSVTKAINRTSNSTFMGGGSAVKKTEQRTSAPAKVTKPSERVQRTPARSNTPQRATDTGTGSQRRTTSNRLRDAQNQKMYGTTRPNLKTAEEIRKEREAQRKEREERRLAAQRQKSGLNDMPTAAQKAATDRALKNTLPIAKESAKGAAYGHLTTLNDIASIKSQGNGKSREEIYDPNLAEKSRQQAEQRVKKYQAKTQETEDAIQKLTKNAKGLEKAYYGAVESGTGMLTDMALGMGTQGGSLAAMFSRTYGASRGKAQQEGATQAEDRAYAAAQAAKEVGTELMFPGAGLARGYAGKQGLKLADTAANILTKNLRGRAADLGGAGVRLLGGVLEENAEEFAGWGLDPFIKEITYGKNARTRNSQQAMKERSNALRAEIQNEDDARAAAAYLSSDDFFEQTVNAYREAGLSKKDAEEVADRMRDYLTASLTGDTDSMEQIEDEVSKKVAGSKKLEWDFDELKDTIASTTLLTAATGLPGTGMTAVKGAALRDQLGDDGVRALASTAIDFEDSEMSLKAKAMKARLDSGNELTSTQVYDLQIGMQEQIRKDTQREESSRRMADKRIKSDNLLTPYRQNENGGIDLDEATEASYREHVSRANEIIDGLTSETKESLTANEKVDGSKAIAGFQTGVFTIEDANTLNYSNTTVRAAFEEATGVDLGQYVVKNKDGSVNIPATNTKTKDALFAMAADNLVKSAQAETANWMDNAKGQVVTQVSARMGAQGSAVLQQALDDVDERDRSKYMMTANATDMLYQAARNMGTEWESIAPEATRMFPGISESKLKMMYEAGLADREMANDKARGRQVRMGQALSEMGEQETATGKVFIDTKVPVKGSVIRTFTEIAKNLGADIHFVDYIYDSENNPIAGANGSYDPNTNTFYLNVATGAETNIGYIFMHETTHYLKTYAPEQYQALENLVRERWFAFNPSQMQDAIARKIEAYKRATKGQQVLTEEQALEEIIADASHDFINDPEFARQVAEEDLGLAKAVLDSIRNALRMLRRIFASGSIDDDTHMNSLFRELDIMAEAEKLWLDAYKVAVQNSAINAVNEWQDKVNGNVATEVEDRFSIVEDLELIKALDADRHRTTYRAMALIDGKLYPPMATQVRDANGKWTMQEGISLGQWVESDITTDPKMFNKEGKFLLKKDSGGNPVPAAYNPYIHSSDSMLNDQFAVAYKRPNMVVVEGEIPESELTSGYRAEHDLDDGRHVVAKDTTGITDWKAGVVQGKLSGKRTVFLTNHFKPTRIVPDSEVAKHIDGKVSGTGVVIPYNVVTPGVREELRKLGTQMAQSENPNYYVADAEEGLTINDGNARWTNERIDDLIGRYGASNPDYSQAYAVLMNPRDFLHITIEDELLRKWRESAASQPEGLTYKEGQRAVWDKSYLEGRLLDDQNFPLDEAELRGQAQTPFLYIRSNKSGQRVLGHEGRHRMRALMEAGVTSVPVVIEDPDTKTSKQNVDSMILGYQEDVYNGAGIVEVNDLVPIKESNRDELIQKFGGEAQVRFSITPEMDEDYMTAVNSGNMDEAQRLVDEAAKMAMPNTKLKGRWYHGTENEFTEFNFSQGGKNGTADGFGIYLTNDPEVASSYGNRMIEGYVNVERPASALTTATLTKPELHRLIRRTVEIEAETLQYDGYDSLEDAKRDTWISNYVNTYSAKNLEDAIADVTDSILQFNGNDMDIIQEIMVGMGIRDYDSAMDFYDMLTEETGIDGFETKWGDESEMADPNTPTIALAFRSNQIKSADPVTYAEDGSVIPLSERFDPTNNDIRYSLPTQDSDGNILTDGQMEYFKNSQARDSQGRLVPVYHTTNHGGFTIFDPSYSDDKRSLFFASNFDVSQTYGKRADKPISIYDSQFDLESLIKNDGESPASFVALRLIDILDSKTGEVVYNHKDDSMMAGEALLSWYDNEKNGRETPYNVAVADEPMDFAEFNNWINDLYNEGYVAQRGYYSCYLNLEDPLIVDAAGANWSAITYGEGNNSIRDAASVSLSAVSIEWAFTEEGVPEGLSIYAAGEWKHDGEWEDWEEGYSLDASDYDTDDPEELQTLLSDDLFDVWENNFRLDYQVLNDISDRFADINGDVEASFDSRYFDESGDELDPSDYDDEAKYTTRDLAELADNQGRDGVIIRNCRDIGGASELRGNALSDIFIAFSSNQVKDINNENPTENPDIRYSFSDEDDLYSYMASVAADSMTNEELAYYEQIAETEEKHNDYLGKMRKWSEEKISEFYESLVSNDEMPSENEKTEEGRIRMSKAREDFFNSLDAKWNDKWLSNGEVLDLKSVKPRIKQLIMAQMRGANATRQYKTEVLNRTLFDVRTAYMMAKRGRIEVADEIIWNSARNMIANLEFVEERADYGTFKEIRDYVKGHRIQIDEGDFPSHDHYKEFLKRNFGKMTLVKDGIGVDQVWQALNEKYGNLFPEEVESPADQLEWISDYLDSYEPVRWAYSSEEAAALAFDIADELGNIVFGYGKPIESLADHYKSKYEEKAKALKARCEEAERELRKTRRENESNEAKIARLQEKNQRIEKKLADEKQKAKDKAAKKKDVKERARYTGRIQKNYDWLTKRLLQPTKDKNIPEGFRKDLARLLCMFDLQTERSKELEQKYGIPSQKTFKMWDLHSKLCNVMNEDNGGIFQTNAYIEFLSENLAKRIDGKSIDSLETPDLLAVDEYLKIIVHQFREYDKVRVGEKRVKLEDLGGKVIQESDDRVSKRGQSKEYGGLIKALDSVVNFAELTPIHFFQRMGTMYTMYKEVRKSFDKYIRNEKYLLNKIQNICGEYYTQKKNRPGSELEAWRDSRSAQELRLKNGTVTMTVAQMMSLYCLSKRNQALLHMTKDGIVITPITEGAKIEKARADIKGRKEQIHSIQLTLADIDLIKTKLTPDQMKIADKLQELMSGEMAEWGNEMSMKLYGIRMFKEKDYFPIKVSSRVTEQNLDDIDITETIKNFGFTKPTQPEARNAIEVDDIFKVVADHCNNMNLYNAYGESISDFWRVFNYKQYSDEGKPTKTVQQSLEEAYGKKAIKYIKNFIKDINGNVAGKRSGGLEEALNATLGKAKKAAVFGNMRVALQQPTAIVRAFAVLSPKYIGAIRVHKGAMQEMFEHCPIAQWKSWGFYDTYMGRDIEDVMMNKWSMSDTALSGIYGQLDNITWTAIWQMCKAEVKDTHPNVKEGTQEFWDLCNERASEVFDKTQVVDSPFHRSDAMRSKDIMVKSLTSFQSEPTLTFNVVRSGFAEAADALRSGNKAEFTKKIAGTVLVFVAQAAVVSATAAIWDAVRRKNPDGGDDDDKKWVEFWTMNFFNNLKDNINLLNNIYLVKEIMPYIDKAFFGGYGASNNLLFQSLDTLTNGITQFQKKLEKGDAYDKSWYDVLTNLFGGFGYMFGIPVKTLMKDFKGITSWLGINVLAADEESLMDSVAEKMGYKPIEKTTESKWFDYERNPLKVTDGSTFDNILNHFGWNLTEREKEQIAADEAAKAQAAKADEIAGKTADLTGEARDKKVWSYVTSYMKAENGDKPLADVIQEGDYKKVQEYRDMYVAAGGDTDYFDERIFATSKSAMKKTIIYDPTDAQIEAQDNIKNYLLTHGMSDYELSEMAYKSNTAKDMKIAFMINDKDAMLETLEPLVRAGLSYEDLERIWDNRNRIDVMKYKSSKGRYADRLKSTGKFIWPTNGSITSYFGYRNAPTRGASSNHPAIDIGAPMGAEVVASDGGVVISTGWNGGYGNSVGIKHDNGMVTYYNHLSAWNVKVGDTVAQGQPIANVGSTGVSTGPHLDFKVLDANGKPVDPLKYLASRS